MRRPERYRYENKYVISSIQAEELSLRTAAVCLADPHVGERGQYNVRSLYFDDYRDSCYHDNEIGIEPRTKWRLRIYDRSDRLIHLEQKRKEGGKICKESTVVSRKFCECLLESAGETDYPAEDRLVNRFLTDCYVRDLRPKVIVEYDREPYVCEDGDVRITFDRNICFSGQVEGFFDPELFLCPVMPSGQQLLEVKYTEFLPAFIQNVLDTGRLQQSTFSKYYLSRSLGKELYI